MVYQLLIVFLCAALVTYVTVPLSMSLAAYFGALDHPDARRVNTSDIPRLGGVALFAGMMGAAFVFFLGVTFFAWEFNDLYLFGDINYYVLYMGVTLAFSVGLFDDINPLRPSTKFAFQILAALVVVLAGVSLDSVRLVFSNSYLELSWLDAPLTVLYLVAFMNIINLIDGMDGLAAGICAIVSLGLLYLVFLRGSYTLCFACVALCGICLAFLRFNFHPARVFMGDCGAHFLGMCLGIISLVGVVRTQSVLILMVPVVIAGVPVIDTLSAIVRRLRQHKKIDQADADHIHHRLLRSGLSHRNVVLVLYAITAFLVLTGCFTVYTSGAVRIALLVFVFIVTSLVIWRFGLFSPVLKHHYDAPRKPKLFLHLSDGETPADTGQKDGDTL